MKTTFDVLRVGESPLTLEDVGRVALLGIPVVMSHEGGFEERIRRGARVIEDRLSRGVPTYGVNTGFGNSVKNTVSSEHAYALAKNLPRYHGCGVGPMLDEEKSRAIMLVRLVSLSTGYSGVRVEVVERLCELLRNGVTPLIPSRGSVGASGDLTPLSYVAALLTGERQARMGREIMSAHEVHARIGLSPLVLGPKESLAIMNGTSVMAALVSLAHARATRICRASAALTAMLVEAMQGQHAHFDGRLFAAKPHPGQALSAAWIRRDLGAGEKAAARGKRIQERYSIRCAPHIIGSAVDALAFARGVIEIEINGASDNPLVDPDTGDVLHGGNFYGGHIAMVADLLKAQLAGIADLMDRQLVLLNDPAQNGGLPENLVSFSGDGRFSHHGFKAMEITASALTAEALKLTMPASVFSRSTESHNQDKVSMGSLSALDLDRVIELVEQVQAVHLIACAQSVDCRGPSAVSPRVRAVWELVRSRIEVTDEDRPMDADIETALDILRSGELHRLLEADDA